MQFMLTLIEIAPFLALFLFFLILLCYAYIIVIQNDNLFTSFRKEHLGLIKFIEKFFYIICFCVFVILTVAVKYDTINYRVEIITTPEMILSTDSNNKNLKKGKSNDPF